MALILSQKMVVHFCQRAQSFVYFEPCDFVLISPACGSKKVIKFNPITKLDRVEAVGVCLSFFLYGEYAQFRTVS